MKAPPVAFGSGADTPGWLEAGVSLLAAERLDLARALAAGQGEAGLAPEARQAVRELRRGALGEVALDGHWGDDPVVDALRARLLRAVTGDGPPLRWEGFLEWAGRRLAGGAVASAPPAALAACAAGLAAARGYGFALESVLAADPPLEERSFDVLSLLALRLALEGRLRPATLGWLVPPTPALQRADPRGRSAWSCALLSARALAEAGQAASAAELYAALAATWFRLRFRAVAREGGVRVPWRPWGGPCGPEHQHAVGIGLHLMLRGGGALRGADRPPWPRGFGGPDLEALEARIGDLVGWGALVTWQVLLDDDLTRAAVLALSGQSAAARARLAAASTPDALTPIRERLAAVLRRPPLAKGLPELPMTREVESLYHKLRRLPDPGVELGTPHGMLPDGRGALVSRLLAAGRAGAASAVRTMLDRPDLARALAPYWLLGAGCDSQAAVLALARWLASREAMPGAEACRAWIRARWPVLPGAAR